MSGISREELVQAVASLRQQEQDAIEKLAAVRGALQIVTQQLAQVDAKKKK